MTATATKTTVEKPPVTNFTLDKLTDKDMRIPSNIFLAISKFTCPHGFEYEMFRNVLAQFNFITDPDDNYWLCVGDPDDTHTIFSSHLDTADSGKPEAITIRYDDAEKRNFKTDGTTLLGADDRTGVALMLYMISKQVPGLYYFFRGEEKGRLGSSALTKNMTFAHVPTGDETNRGWKRVVAFDRRGYTSVITKQSGQFTCSPEFADALALELNRHDFNYAADPTGSYTDSYSFKDQIPECTNLSVGYANAHGTSEMQDIDFMNRLGDALCAIKWEELPTVRDTKASSYAADKKEVPDIGTSIDTLHRELLSSMGKTDVINWAMARSMLLTFIAAHPWATTYLIQDLIEGNEKSLLEKLALQKDYWIKS